MTARGGGAGTATAVAATRHDAAASATDPSGRSGEADAHLPGDARQGASRGRIADRAFVAAWRVSRWSRLRFTGLGRGIAGLGMTAGVFGLDVSRTAASQVFALCVCALLTAWVTAGRWRTPPTLVRELPPRATVGRTVEYTLRVEVAATARALTDLEVHDELAARWPTRAEARDATRRNAAGDNFFDRRVGFPRWAAHVIRTRGGEIDPVTIARLEPGRAERVTLRFVPRRRGLLRFERVVLLRPDPLGLVNARGTRSLPARLVVRPELHPVPALRPGASAADPRGAAARRQASHAGERPDFRGLREWRSGDPVRRIHWPATARTGVPLVRELEREPTGQVEVHLDLAGPPGDAFEAAVTVALSVAAALARSGDSVLDAVRIGRAHHALSGARRLAVEHALDAIALAAVATAAASRATAAQFVSTHTVIHVLPCLDAPAIALVEALARRGVAQAVLVCDTNATASFAVAHVPVHRIDPVEVAAGLAAWDARTR